MSDEQKQPEPQLELSQVLQPDKPVASQPAPIVGGGASDLRQMKEEAI